MLACLLGGLSNLSNCSIDSDARQGKTRLGKLARQALAVAIRYSKRSEASKAAGPRQLPTPATAAVRHGQAGFQAGFQAGAGNQGKPGESSTTAANLNAALNTRAMKRLLFALELLPLLIALARATKTALEAGQKIAEIIRSHSVP